ncbi:MAG: demethylphylloquinone reductase [Blastocatellia bacterium]|jgi:NADH dehydrogenase|nr:demethylphylloquinone reductase [Blastocatellia bacterium]
MNTKTRIVIVGGGFGGVFTALDLAGSGEVTLISDEDHFLFTPMLYEYVSGEVEAWHIAPAYKELLDENVNFVRGAATDIDLSARHVVVNNRSEPIPYDVLVLALGGITNYAGVSGAEEFAIPFRKLAHADRLRQRMIDALDHIPPSLPPQDVREALTFAVVGGGASGIELSTKMADLLRDAFRRRALHGEPRVLVIEMGDRVVPGMGEEIREFVDKALLESRVEVHTETRVTGVGPHSITLEHGGTQRKLQTAAVVWVAGVRPNPLLDKLDIEKDRRGLIVVEPTLQVPGHENVFALGDIALFNDVVPTLAGTAQLAFQEASLLGRNVRAFQAGEKLHTKSFVELGEALSLGTDRAAILAGGQVLSGALARQARFAMYTSRMPTWHHRLRVGASWFFGGTAPRPLQPLGF